jgi:predicted RNA binding protein YcfA (HicA-like mRNA interferase family)
VRFSSKRRWISKSGCGDVEKKKLLEKLLSGSHTIRFDEFIGLLQSIGFVQDRSKGSHHIFSHPDVDEILSIQPRKDGKAKPYQLKQFVKIIQDNGLTLEEGLDDA